jgi:glycosyltransferase involved in cell wall biosynthesis
MPAWYSASDLFVLGSSHEAAGYALIEACACGLLPVVTDIAPFRAITCGGAIGVHWKARDADACANALITAAARVRESGGAASGAFSGGEPADGNPVRAHFDAHLSWPAVASRACVIYEALLARRRANGRSARATLGASPCRAEPSTSNASNTEERPSSTR